jgi:hypothetical protein
METLPTEEGTLPPPARYLSPSRAAKQAARAEKCQSSPMPLGFGRKNRRHPDPRPLPDFADEKVKENTVRFDLTRSGKKTTQIEAVCLTCGSLGTFTKRSGAVNATGTHLEAEHPGMTGHVRNDIL